MIVYQIKKHLHGNKKEKQRARSEDLTKIGQRYVDLDHSLEIQVAQFHTNNCFVVGKLDPFHFSTSGTGLTLILSPFSSSPFSLSDSFQKILKLLTEQ